MAFLLEGVNFFKQFDNRFIVASFQGDFDLIEADDNPFHFFLIASYELIPLVGWDITGQIRCVQKTFFGGCLNLCEEFE